jgi:hypothetical protein
MRPARSTGPSASASGEAFTPAAHSTVRAGARTSAPEADRMSTPSSSMSTTRARCQTSTPSSARSLAARRWTGSVNSPSTRGPPSISEIVALRVSMAR